VSLAEIAATTRLSPRYVKAIDEGRFEDLPVGIYARSYVRAFAGAVGLDTAELAELLLLLPHPPDPLPALKEAGARRTAMSFLTVPARVYAAALVDVLLLLTLDAFIVSIVGAACRVRAGTLLAETPLPLFVLCATTWALYFILLAGVGGETAGQLVCGVAERQPHAPLRLRVILLRTAGMAGNTVERSSSSP
jgi:hypothetical protein